MPDLTSEPWRNHQNHAWNDVRIRGKSMGNHQIMPEMTSESGGKALEHAWNDVRIRGKRTLKHAWNDVGIRKEASNHAWNDVRIREESMGNHQIMPEVTSESGGKPSNHARSDVRISGNHQGIMPELTSESVEIIKTMPELTSEYRRNHQKHGHELSQTGTCRPAGTFLTFLTEHDHILTSGSAGSVHINIPKSGEVSVKSDPVVEPQQNPHLMLGIPYFPGRSTLFSHPCKAFLTFLRFGQFMIPFESLWHGSL